MELLQKIKRRGEEAQQKLMKMMEERDQLQQQYDTTLQQKKEVEGRYKNEAEERVRKSLMWQISTIHRNYQLEQLGPLVWFPSRQTKILTFVL
jgi:hypothetical protein